MAGSGVRTGRFCAGTIVAIKSPDNAIINLMGAVGGVYSLIMIKFMTGSGDRQEYLALFLSIAVLMVVAVLVLFLTIKENKLRADMVEEDVMREEEVKSTAKLPKEVKKSLVFILISVALWFTAYNAITTAFSRYATHVWGMENGGYANCLMIATVAAIISYIPIGFISSKIGRKKTILSGIVMLATCYLCAGLYSTYHVSMNLFFAIIGFAWAAIGVNSLPMVVEISAGGDVGKYTGYYYAFSMSAQVITPILSGFLLYINFYSNGTMVAPHNFVKNKAVFNLIYNSVRNNKIVYTPTHILCPGAIHIAPPGILNFFGIKIAECVFKA
mgnify:CR=1 FL=1